MMTRSLFEKTAWVLAAIFAVCLFGGTAQAQEIEFPEEWQQAVEPLRSVPVQDYGFIRSGFTFGENHLMALNGKKSFQGLDAFNVIMFALLYPQEIASVPVIKISHPELAKSFETKMISLQEYRKPDRKSVV